MHMTIPLKVLQAGLKAVAPACHGRSPLPVMKHVLIQDGALTCTDLDLTIWHRLTDFETGIYHENRGCTVNYKSLADWVGAVRSDVMLRLSSDQLEVTAGKSKTTLPTLPAEEFPQISFAEGKAYTFEENSLQQTLRKVDVARATQEETRAVMTGTQFWFREDGLALCCTDGRRLAHQVMPGIYEPSTHVLSGADHILALDGDITLHLAHGGWAVDAGDTRLGGRMLEGNFPDWPKIAKFETPLVATVDRPALLSALRRVLLFCTEKNSPNLVSFDLSAGQMRLSGSAPGCGQAVEEMGIGYEGADLAISFNGKLLAEGLAVLDTPTIEWGFQTHDRASRIRVGEFNYVIMPVKLREAVGV